MILQIQKICKKINKKGEKNIPRKEDKIMDNELKFYLTADVRRILGIGKTVDTNIPRLDHKRAIF